MWQLNLMPKRWFILKSEAYVAASNIVLSQLENVYQLIMKDHLLLCQIIKKQFSIQSNRRRKGDYSHKPFYYSCCLQAYAWTEPEYNPQDVAHNIRPNISTRIVIHFYLLVDITKYMTRIKHRTFLIPFLYPLSIGKCSRQTPLWL